MKGPTATQTRYIESIESFWKEHGIGPTQKELGERVNRGPGTVRYMLGRLEDNGHLLPNESKSRSIKTTRMSVHITVGAWPSN